MTPNNECDDPTAMTLTILGVYLYAPAYPNVKFVIDLMRQNESLRLLEINCPFFRKPIAWKKQGIAAKFLKATRTIGIAIYCHTNVLFRYFRSRKSAVVYIPYPALGVLTLFSLLPPYWRPARLIADAFISIYDTAVTDRKLIATDTWLARALFAFERRAFLTATCVTVDTFENRSYYADLFALPEDKFQVVPLATDEETFVSSAYTGRTGPCNVVFVGTFVPLQGADIIARAILMLRNRHDIRFTIIGTGQTAEEFADITAAEPPGRLTWIQDWQDSRSVAAHIDSADICLGIFSDGAKAHRVWPYKNYAYMTIGRAIITADTKCAQRMLAAVDYAPFATVPAADSQALVDKIVRLADSPADREQLARNARRYYEEYLANKIVEAKLVNGIFAAEASG